MIIPEHSKVTAQEFYRPSKKSVRLPEHHEDCRAVASVLALVGGKWSVMIIVTLGDGPLRFNQIKQVISGISQRMLTLTLRGLEREGLVTRTQFPTIPPRVDYGLTPLGRSLWQDVKPLCVWAHAHMNEMKRARETFDKHDNRWIDAHNS